MGPYKSSYRTEVTICMHLSEHSLRQIDDAYLRSLELEALRGLSLRLLAALKEARERLNQKYKNDWPSKTKPGWRLSGTATVRSLQ